MPPVPKQPTKRSGAPKAKGAVRAKTGCYTCRIRRKKCDERPNDDNDCETCVRLHLECLGFGAKRPEWLRENRKVIDVREKIKQFLAAQGMIKGTTGSGARNAEQELPRLRLRESDYSSPSESPPPTPVLSLNEELRPHPVSSERDEPYPSSLSSSYNDVRSVQTLSPDSDYSPQAHLFRDDGPMLSPGFTTHPIQSNSLVSLAAPWHNITRYPQQSFPSPALGSQFSPLYSPLEDGLGANDFVVAHDQTGSIPYTISFHNGEDYSLVNNYMEKVLEIQYLLADQKDIRDFILGFTYSSPIARDAVCLLSAVHQFRDLGLGGASDVDKRYENICHQLLEGTSATAPSAEDAMAGLHVVSSFLFNGGHGDWYNFLRVSILFSKRVLGQNPFGPKEALIRCSKEERFIIKTSMWFDVLASATHLQIPQFLNEYRQIFGRNAAYIESPVSLASPRKELCMLSVMGCESHIVWAMAEISNLAYWKQVQQQRRQLSMLELVDRGKEIENHLLPGHAVDQQLVGIDYERHMTSEIFRASSRIYLHTVISGSHPHCREIQEGVEETVEILEKIPSTTKMSRTVIRSVVFSIFIAACLTDNVVHRDYFLERLSQEGEGSYGNCQKAKDVIVHVWRERRNRPKEPVPWQEELQRAGMLLV